MYSLTITINGTFVALLAEGVDRNVVSLKTDFDVPGSPSSRRAWIEMAFFCLLLFPSSTVALLAEGVDRN